MWQELIQPRHTPSGGELVEDIREVLQRRHAVLQAGARQAVQVCRASRRIVGAREQIILPAQSSLRVIVPISGRRSWSSIGGIHSTGAVFVASTARSGRRVSSFRSKPNPAT